MHAIVLAAALLMSRAVFAGSEASDDEPRAGDEVIVAEESAPEPEKVQLPAAQLREVAGSLGDPVRAVSALPGVVPTTLSVPDVYIRGAPPGNTALFIDGVRVPLLYHGGVATSVVAPGLVDTV